MRIAGSAAIVTGASSGIGEATASELARRGALVVLAARRPDRLEALAEGIRSRGGQALAVPTDVTSRPAIDHLVEQTVATFGRVDVLVNNAGIGQGSSVLESPDAALRHLLEVNLLAAARCIQAVVPHMDGPAGGVIVNVGSVVGEGAGLGLYAASKYGLRGLSNALRWELRPYGIAVVLVEPGFVRTELTASTPLPMPGPEVVARAIVGGIERPRRRIIVPWYYTPIVYAMKILPGLTDFLMLEAERRLEARRPTRIEDTLREND